MDTYCTIWTFDLHLFDIWYVLKYIFLPIWTFELSMLTFGTNIYIYFPTWTFELTSIHLVDLCWHLTWKTYILQIIIKYIRGEYYLLCHCEIQSLTLWLVFVISFLFPQAIFAAHGMEWSKTKSQICFKTNQPCKYHC